MSTLGDTTSTSGGHLEYIGGCSVHWRDITIHLGGISWVYREMFSTSEGYHEYIRGISWFLWGRKLIKVFDLYWKLRSTEHPLMNSWYPPTCIMASLWCMHTRLCSDFVLDTFSTSLQSTFHTFNKIIGSKFDLKNGTSLSFWIVFHYHHLRLYGFWNIKTTEAKRPMNFELALHSSICLEIVWLTDVLNDSNL